MPASPLPAADSASPTKRQRFYLPEVDGIRCIAFALVWVHHYSHGPRQGLADLKSYGWIGVDVFLVLSSFLITSLLLIENDAKGRISLSRFYSRRFLRIWPLLGLAFCLNYLVLPAIDYFPNGFHNAVLLRDLRCHAIPNLLLLGNWSAAIFVYLQYGFVGHLWTINLEEQFYFLWPILLLFVVSRPRRLLAWCGGLIVISYLARFYYVEVGFPHPALWVSTITRMDPLAWGGILALLYRERRKAPRIAWHWIGAILSVVIFVAALLLARRVLAGWQWTGAVWWKLGLADICLTIAIGCVLYSNLLAALLRLPPLPWLGKISYGLYVYHAFFAESRVSLRVAAWAANTFSPGSLFGWLLGMTINGLALVAVSALSYYAFERWFLKFKERFETILSRPA
ncbi:MAG TPA: acyltransferase [Chthoniobacterales bacterium]